MKLIIDPRLTWFLIHIWSLQDASISSEWIAKKDLHCTSSATISSFPCDCTITKNFLFRKLGIQESSHVDRPQMGPRTTSITPQQGNDVGQFIHQSIVTAPSIPLLPRQFVISILVACLTKFMDITIHGRSKRESPINRHAGARCTHIDSDHDSKLWQCWLDSGSRSSARTIIARYGNIVS